MKFNLALLLTASILLIYSSPSVSLPTVQATRDRQIYTDTSKDIYHQANPAVVTVYAGKEIGSGSIISSDGLVLTNHHVAQWAADDSVYIRTADGKRHRGSVVGSDRRFDLALIQIHTSEQFPTIPLASASGIQIGQSVYAIGSPFGRPGVMTTGILSRIRINGDLQANVVLEPGNSGGPLLNAQGEMIGINRSVIENEAGRNTGISLATSVLDAKHLIAQARPAAVQVATHVANKSLVPNSLRLGIMLHTRDFVIQQVQANSPAAIAGLQVGDRLVAINGIRLTTVTEVQSFMSRNPEVATFTVNRNQRSLRVRVHF